MLGHPTAPIPEQGWKVHVSATLDNAKAILDRVSRYCLDHELSFKFVPTEGELLRRNMKDAERSSSGKFITIYPTGESQLETTLRDLDSQVGGMDGPYILTDLRWARGPLHVRYGAFHPMTMHDEWGNVVPAIRAPGGSLVPDRRTAGFATPEWVTMPPFLREQYEALGSSAAPQDFGYDVRKAIQFSNAGGVYEARTPTGDRVVLKEARPLAGLTPDRRDAVARLNTEEDALRRFAGASNVVGLRDSFTLGDHRFLALDFVEGSTLNHELVARAPIIRASATAADYRAYRAWALDVIRQIEEQLARIHAAGYVYGDLHPANIIITPDGRAVFIDFEMIAPVGDDTSSQVGAPGFIPTDGRDGIASDDYALACLKLFMFIPLTILLPLDPLKVDELLEVAGALYDLDEGFLAGVRDGLNLPSRGDTLAARSIIARRADAALRAWDIQSEDGIFGIQVMISRSIMASADFSRADRAHPGDIRQFAENGYGLAHGVAGVIHALEASNLDVDPQAMTWLHDATSFDNPTEQCGLYDGLAGVAWVARRHGRHDDADQILTRLRDIHPTNFGTDLYGGLPGIGLYYLSETGRDPSLIDDAVRIAAELRLRHEARKPIDRAESTPHIATGQGGLMRGATGTALFALRLYERTGDSAHLRLAEDTLSYDLAHCTTAHDGSLQLNEGWRLMPYLATGSVGCGLVAAQIVSHVRVPDRYRSALDGIQLAAQAPFTLEPGLFNGRAGFIHFLVALGRLGLSNAASEAALTAHVEALKVHAVRHSTGIAFPGEGLLRLSTDLATGSAGVLTALQGYELLTFDEARSGWGELLPLLLPESPVAVAPGSHGQHAERR